jgi:hypothetical protein
MMAEGEIILYTTEDGVANIRLRVSDGTVWLSQAEIAELFQTTPQNVTQHIRSVYADGELVEAATCKERLQVQTEGSRSVSRITLTYNLDMILAVGFRVRSPRGSQFRRWAIERLREYLVKGFTMDDARLKDSGDYFDELLARIRDIRSSEKMFYKAVLKIYATSTDYDPRSSVSRAFFAAVQNKMHWAVHGHTAAELIKLRADAEARNMGLTSFAGERIRLEDAGIAKNYLNEAELDALNRIVNVYLEFAELQALNRRPMTMSGWITKLDDFLKLSERDILTHAGRVSHAQAEEHARLEFEKYKEAISAEPSLVEKHFQEAIGAVNQLDKKRRGKSPKGDKP